MTVAQSAFVNQLIAKLASTAPDIDPALVILTGSTEIRTAFPADQVPAILLAYMAGLRVTFAIMTGFAGIAFLASLFVSWKRLHRKVSKDDTI